jgi:hypothetical protein
VRTLLGERLNSRFPNSTTPELDDSRTRNSIVTRRRTLWMAAAIHRRLAANLTQQQPRGA